MNELRRMYSLFNQHHPSGHLLKSHFLQFIKDEGLKILNSHIEDDQKNKKYKILIDKILNFKDNIEKIVSEAFCDGKKSKEVCSSLLRQIKENFEYLINKDDYLIVGLANNIDENFRKNFRFFKIN